jgi:hypothetical protein
MNNIPSVLAIVLCDWIIIEQGTGKKTLVGLFDNLNAAVFPVLRPMGFYTYAPMRMCDDRSGPSVCRRCTRV